MRLLAKKKAVQGNGRKAKKLYQGGFKDQLMKTGENREDNEILSRLLSEKAHRHWRRSFIKVAAQKIVEDCLRNQKARMPNQSFDFQKWWRMMIWRTTKKFNQGCCLLKFMVKIPDGESIECGEFDQCAAWRKPDDEKSGETVLIKVFHGRYWSGQGCRRSMI